MNRYVADTHAVHWYLIGSSRLGPRARASDAGTAGTAVIYVSAITIAELFYLNQKAGQIPLFHDEWKRLREAAQFVLVPLTPDEVPDFELDAAIPEMHDRLIAGLARRLGATCITRDPEIIAGGVVPTVW